MKLGQTNIENKNLSGNLGGATGLDENPKTPSKDASPCESKPVEFFVDLLRGGVGNLLLAGDISLAGIPGIFGFEARRLASSGESPLDPEEAKQFLNGEKPDPKISQKLVHNLEKQGLLNSSNEQEYKKYLPASLAKEDWLVQEKLAWGGSTLKLSEKFIELTPQEQVEILNALGTVAEIEALQNELTLETDENVRLVFEIQIHLLKGEIPQGKLKMVEFLDQAQTSKDVQILEMGKKFKDFLGESLLQHLDQVDQWAESVNKNRRELHSVGDSYLDHWETENKKNLAYIREKVEAGEIYSLSQVEPLLKKEKAYYKRMARKMNPEFSERDVEQVTWDMPYRDDRVITRLLEIESPAAWQKMTTVRDQRKFALETAQWIREEATYGSYEVAQQFYLMAAFDEIKGALQEVDQSKLAREVWKIESKMDPFTGACNIGIGDAVAQDLALKDLVQNPTGDSIAKEALSDLEDMLDPNDDWGNLSDASKDLLATEAFYMVGTAVVTFGTGTAFKAGVSGVSWVRRGLAAGGMRSLLIRGGIEVSQAVLEASVDAFVTTQILGRPYDAQKFGQSVLLYLGFHLGMNSWGRVAQKSGLNRNLAQASQKGQLGRGLLLQGANLGGRSLTQAGIITSSLSLDNFLRGQSTTSEQIFHSLLQLFAMSLGFKFLDKASGGAVMKAERNFEKMVEEGRQQNPNYVKEWDIKGAFSNWGQGLKEHLQGFGGAASLPLAIGLAWGLKKPAQKTKALDKGNQSLHVDLDVDAAIPSEAHLSQAIDHIISNSEITAVTSKKDLPGEVLLEMAPLNSGNKKNQPTLEADITKVALPKSPKMAARFGKKRTAEKILPEDGESAGVVGLPKNTNTGSAGVSPLKTLPETVLRAKNLSRAFNNKDRQWLEGVSSAGEFDQIIARHNEMVELVETLKDGSSKGSLENDVLRLEQLNNEFEEIRRLHEESDLVSRALESEKGLDADVFDHVYPQGKNGREIPEGLKATPLALGMKGAKEVEGTKGMRKGYWKTAQDFEGQYRTLQELGTALTALSGKISKLNPETDAAKIQSLTREYADTKKLYSEAAFQLETSIEVLKRFQDDLNNQGIRWEPTLINRPRSFTELLSMNMKNSSGLLARLTDGLAHAWEATPDSIKTLGKLGVLTLGFSAASYFNMPGLAFAAVIPMGPKKGSGKGLSGAARGGKNLRSSEVLQAPQSREVVKSHISLKDFPPNTPTDEISLFLAGSLDAKLDTPNSHVVFPYGVKGSTPERFGALWKGDNGVYFGSAGNGVANVYSRHQLLKSGKQGAWVALEAGDAIYIRISGQEMVFNFDGTNLIPAGTEGAFWEIRASVPAEKAVLPKNSPVKVEHNSLKPDVREKSIEPQGDVVKVEHVLKSEGKKSSPVKRVGVYQDPQFGDEWIIEAGVTEVVIGRDPTKAQILLNENNLYSSGKQAILYFENGGWWLEDVSRNGTFLVESKGRETRFPNELKTNINRGDRIRFGLEDYVFIPKGDGGARLWPAKG